MKIAFLTSNQNKIHEGVIRPFFNFAKVLRSENEVFFILLNCTADVEAHFSRSRFNVISSDNERSIISDLKNIRPDFVISDDDPNRLRFLLKIKKAIDTAIICYVQVLYGSHAIASCFDSDSLTLKQKLVFMPLKHVPFSFFSRRYASLLKSFDLVVANSKITASFLHALYGLDIDGIIYPSVDTEVFKPGNNVKDGKEVLIYLGSHLGDIKVDFIKKIVDNIVDVGWFANLFGNSKIALDIIGKGNSSVMYHSNLSDSALATLYSRCKLTVCPEKWEQFGLVPVESISCGTPVLAFNCMGFQETINEKTGWLANNEEEFLRILRSVLKKDCLPSKELRDLAIERFSIGVSTDALERLLQANHHFKRTVK